MTIGSGSPPNNQHESRLSHALFLGRLAGIAYGLLELRHGQNAGYAEFTDDKGRRAAESECGGLVVVAGVLFHGAWAVLALVTYRIEIASRRERRSLIAMG